MSIVPLSYLNAGIAADPGALPDDRSFIAFTVSEMVGSSSSSGLHSTCCSLLIASSLIDGGRVRTPSKCSAQLLCQSEDYSSICTKEWEGS